MKPIELLIPLGFGLVLIICPRLLLKRACSGEELAKKQATARKIGYVLLAVSALYFLLVVMGQHGQ